MEIICIIYLQTWQFQISNVESLSVACRKYIMSVACFRDRGTWIKNSYNYRYIRPTICRQGFAKFKGINWPDTVGCNNWILTGFETFPACWTNYFISLMGSIYTGSVSNRWRFNYCIRHMNRRLIWDSSTQTYILVHPGPRAEPRIWKWGGQYIEQSLVYTVKTLTFEKGGGCMTPPPPIVAPPLPCTPPTTNMPL